MGILPILLFTDYQACITRFKEGPEFRPGIKSGMNHQTITVIWGDFGQAGDFGHLVPTFGKVFGAFHGND